MYAGTHWWKYFPLWVNIIGLEWRNIIHEFFQTSSSKTFVVNQRHRHLRKPNLKFLSCLNSMGYLLVLSNCFICLIILSFIQDVTPNFWILNESLVSYNALPRFIGSILNLKCDPLGVSEAVYPSFWRSLSTQESPFGVRFYCTSKLNLYHMFFVWNELRKKCTTFSEFPPPGLWKFPFPVLVFPCVSKNVPSPSPLLWIK